MAISKTYIPSEFTYTSSKIEEVLSKLQLKLQDNPGQDFTEDFADDTDFTYDNTKAEFSGGQIKQTDKRPTDAIFYNNFDDTDVKTNPEDGNWGDGTLTGTLTGGASIISNVLNLSGDANCDWNNDNISSLLQTGCIRIRFRPKYTGAAPAVQTLFWANNNTQNRIMIRINSTLIQCYIYNSSSVLMMNMNFTFSAVAEQIYEIELNFDFDSGIQRAFIDGLLEDSDTATGTHGACNNFVRCGGDSSGHNIDILDVLLFDTVQHTSNYTPDWSNVYDYDYLASNVILPEMGYIGAGTLVTFDAFTSTESGSPRYSLQIGQSGNYLYWDGAAWSISDGTYAQANDATTFNANLASLDIEGEIYGQFKLHFIDSNTQSSVDEVTASLTVQIYPTDNPTAETTTGFNNEGISNFLMTVTETGSDAIKVTLSKDGVDYYCSSDWTIADGTYAQTNTATEILTNIATFNNVGANTKIKLFFHSDDGTTTPDFTSVSVDYDFWGGDAPSVNSCIVYGYVYDSNNQPVSGATILCRLTKPIEIYNQELMIFNKTISITTDNIGYWDAELIETENMPVDMQYEITISYNDSVYGSITRSYFIDVPNETSKNIKDLI